MEHMMNMKSDESKREKESFSFSKEENGVKKTVRGEQVENGWIITIDKEWDEKNTLGEASERRYGCWKYISKENPMEKLEQQESAKDPRDDVNNMLADITKSQGMLLV